MSNLKDKVKKYSKLKRFILITLLPYKVNPSLCGYEEHHCVFFTNSGKKCAVGKWMKEGDWQYCSAGIYNVSDEGYSFNDIFYQQALNLNISLDLWDSIQEYHDNIANSKTDKINFIVDDLELKTNLVLSSLRY